MTLALDPGQSWVRVWSRKAGLLARLAHDLCIESRAARVEVAQADGSLEVRVAVPVTSLRVLGQVHAGGRIEPLRPGDHQEIEGNLRGPRVLEADRHPEVRWSGRGPLSPGAGRVELQGELELRGTTRPLPLAARLVASPDGLRVEGEVEVVQSRFGIEPFSALLGALKVQDPVGVSWSLYFPGGKL